MMQYRALSTERTIMMAFDVKLIDISTVKTTCRSSCPLDPGSVIVAYLILQLQGVLFHSTKKEPIKSDPTQFFLF
jgi:hypothetical protein